MIEQCQTLGTAGDIIFADMSQYLLVDGGAAKSDMSIHVRFVYDESCFRWVFRVDGKPLWNNVMTPATGAADTRSPFVVLGTANGR